MKMRSLTSEALLVILTGVLLIAAGLQSAQGQSCPGSHLTYIVRGERGEVNLLPNQPSVGLINFKLDSSQSDDLDGAQEAVKANYTMQAGSISVPVQLQVANFASAQEAKAAMQAFASKHNLSLESKTKSGTTVGQRLTWGDGKAIMWSNGSLQYLARSDFPKTTSNLEEALPF